MRVEELSREEREFVRAIEEAFPDRDTGGVRMLAILSGARQWGASNECLEILQDIAERASLARMAPEST